MSWWPGPSLLRAAFAGVALAAASVVVPELALLLPAALVAGASVLWAEWRWLARLPGLELARALPTASVGRPAQLDLRVRNPAAVRDHVNEIRVFEAEADRITLRLKTVIFDSDLPLDAKMHARDSVDVIDALADLAEDISDELSIAAIKRAL